MKKNIKHKKMRNNHKNMRNNHKNINRILYYIVGIIGVLGIIDTVVLIPFVPGIDSGIVMPAIIGVLLVGYASLKLLKPGYILKNKIIRFTVTGCICLGILLFVIVEGLIVYHANKPAETDEDIDFIMVLGCGIYPDGRLTLTLKNRLDAAMEYGKNDTNAIYIVSGGQGRTEPRPEAYAMKDYLISKGIPEFRILAEPKSTSTNENIGFSSAMIDQHYPGTRRRTAIVSSDFHMFRSKLLARHYGLVPYGVPGETPWYLRMNCYLREFLAVFKTLIIDM